MDEDRPFEPLLVGTIRTWVASELPDHPAAAAPAAAAGGAAYESGALLAAARARALSFAACWARHPAHAAGCGVPAALQAS